MKRPSLARLKTLSLSAVIWLLGILAESRGAIAAERIYLSYSLLERSISIAALEEYAQTCEISGELTAYARYADRELLKQFCQILTTSTPKEIDAVAISQFLYTPQGEALLKRLGEVIRSDARQPGFFGLRAAFILAATDPQGLTLLNLLKKFPSRSIRIDLARAAEIVEELQRTVDRTKHALALVNQISQQAAHNNPINESALADLRRSGEYQWDKLSLQLRDRDRPTSNYPGGRVFVADVYLPRTDTPAPTIVISHGLGSDRTTFAYLARHLASHGFAVAVPQHPGSDASQLEALLVGVASEVAEPREFLDRPLDVSHLLDELERRSQQYAQFRNRMNLERVGVLGQSFGGYTALALAGARINFEQLQADCQQQDESWNVSLFLQCRALDLYRRQLIDRAIDNVLMLSEETRTRASRNALDNTLAIADWFSPSAGYEFRDDRIQAAIAINPIDSSLFGESGLAKIDIPTLIVAGGADTVAPALYEQIQPFTWLDVPEKYLVLMHPGTHFSTLGEMAHNSESIPVPTEAIGPNPALARRYTKALSLAFFQAYINDRPEYELYLQASDIESLSQEPIPLSLVRELSAERLQQAIGR